MALIFSLPLLAVTATEQPAAVATIEAGDLVEYPRLSDEVRELVDASLELTRMDLAYAFGSATPEKGGMDCSGAICYLLSNRDLAEKVPRMSHTIYLWLEEHGTLTRFSGVHDPDHPVFKKLEPGDLVFWEGTYAVEERDPPISHVMLYLGTHRADGRGVLFGSSSGRRYRGKKIHGVSVFDFSVPSESSEAKMVAFGPVPGIGTVPATESGEEPGSEPEVISEATMLPKTSPPKKPVKALLQFLSGKRE